jgi:hypothetical protein
MAVQGEFVQAGVAFCLTRTSRLKDADFRSRGNARIQAGAGYSGRRQRAVPADDVPTGTTAPMTGRHINGPSHSVGDRPLTIDEAPFVTASGTSGLSAELPPVSMICVSRVHTAGGHPLVRG